MKRGFNRAKSVLRRIADLMVVVVLMAMIAAVLQKSGLLAPETGQFTAIDGDSLRKGETEYRLHAIDAPEFRQTCKTAKGVDYACGREARDELRRLVSGKTLDCQIRETDRYGRLVADCRAGGTSINGALVRQGWAVAYVRHGADYAADEAEAKAAGRGIWQGDFERPEAWRARHRNVQGSVAGDVPPD